MALKLVLNPFKLDQNCVCLGERLLGGSAESAMAAIQPAVWCGGAKKALAAWRQQTQGLQTYQWQGSSFLNSFPISRPHRELWNGSEGPSKSMFRNMKDDAGLQTHSALPFLRDWSVAQSCYVKPSWQSLWVEENRGGVWGGWIMLLRRHGSSTFPHFKYGLRSTQWKHQVATLVSGFHIIPPEGQK